MSAMLLEVIDNFHYCETLPSSGSLSAAFFLRGERVFLPFKTKINKLPQETRLLTDESHLQLPELRF